MNIKTITTQDIMNLETIEGRKSLMKEFGGTSSPFKTQNGDGEDVLISVHKDKIEVTTNKESGVRDVIIYGSNGKFQGQHTNGLWKDNGKILF